MKNVRVNDAALPYLLLALGVIIGVLLVTRPLPSLLPPAAVRQKPETESETTAHLHTVGGKRKDGAA